jgi:hypothetical protein
MFVYVKLLYELEIIQENSMNRHNFIIFSAFSKRNKVYNESKFNWKISGYLLINSSLIIILTLLLFIIFSLDLDFLDQLNSFKGSF